MQQQNRSLSAEEDVMQKLEDSYKASKQVESTSSADDDDPMSYFSKLADS